MYHQKFTNLTLNHGQFGHHMKDRQGSDHLNGASLHDHLLRECIAMAKYALASGLKVPPGLMQDLEDLSTHQVNGNHRGASNSEKSSDPVGQATALNGSNHTVTRLAQIHTRLAEILAPASPRTVLLMENESRSGGMWGFLGPVGLIRRMMALAILFLAALIGFSVSPLVNATTITQGIFQSEGIVLLFNLLFLLAAAGLGACFAGLFQANRFIANNTFDPKYESSYWIRLVLGLMAGIILSELIPLDFIAGDETRGPGSATHLQALGKPMLALLGGFSAAAVYRIISRIVDALESLVRGDTKDQVAAQVQATRAQFESQLTQNRLALAANLSRLQQRFGTGADPQELKQELDKMVSSLVPADTFNDQQ
jgi:hypothetical protein